MAGAASAAPDLKIRPADPKLIAARKMVLTMGATFLIKFLMMILRKNKIRIKSDA